jgi:TonB family protein
MSPLSLLFSSDEETSRGLIQTLHQLELEVEHCPEIFAAVEKITSRSFDIIACDWQEGLEAAFLFKTARELKANSSAFTIAVADADSSVAAREAGANFVLRKPIVPEKAKYALLTCDEFLRHMQTWLPKLGFPTAEEAAAQKAENRSWPSDGSQGVPSLAARPPRPSPGLTGKATHTAALVPASAIFDESFSTYFGIQTLFSSLPERESDEPKPRKKYSRPLLATALSVALLSAGYVFSEPLRNQSVTTAVSRIYGRALEKTHAWLDRSDETPPPSQLAQNDNPASPHPRLGSLHIRITPAPSSTGRPDQPLPAEAHPQPPSGDSQPALVAKNTTYIPASLQAPIQGTSLRDVSAKVTSSLLASFEPVTLPEELAQKLVLQKISPNYPEQALKAGLQGPVVLEAWIARDGTIRDLKLIRGSFLLGQAAYKAVKQWRYQPYLLNGQAVETQTYVTVDFRLP